MQLSQWISYLDFRRYWLPVGHDVTQLVLRRVYLSTLFYKQPVHKQLVLGRQIATQLSGLKPFSPSNNKNYKWKKIGVFPLW